MCVYLFNEIGLSIVLFERYFVSFLFCFFQKRKKNCLKNIVSMYLFKCTFYSLFPSISSSNSISFSFSVHLVITICSFSALLLKFLPILCKFFVVFHFVLLNFKKKRRKISYYLYIFHHHQPCFIHL